MISDIKKPETPNPPPPLLPSKLSEPKIKPSVVKIPQVKKTPFLNKTKVLYVGDSLAHTANLRLVEKANNCRISSAWAYSSVQDGNAMNFAEVVKDNLQSRASDDYEVLVMSSPTADISNLNTNLPPGVSTESLEEKVIHSSQNMFNIAREALSLNTNLKKVIVMEHSPRFDDP